MARASQDRSQDTRASATGPAFLKLITTGRKTRLPHIVLLRFVTVSGSFFVVAGGEKSDWERNLSADWAAKVRMGQLVYLVQASEATPEEKAQVAGLYVRKYGRRLVGEWYHSFDHCFRLAPTTSPTIRGASRGQNQTSVDFSGWKSAGVDYLQHVTGAFDSAAEEYDFTIASNYINRYVRKRSIQELLKLVKPSSLLLEVGCGTGEEAITVSKHVSKIVATDISETMIEFLRRKVAARRLEAKIRPQVLRAADLTYSIEPSRRGFDAVYSFNGALNCEPEMERFVKGLHAVLVEDGYFVVSIRNSLCVSEMLSHALIMQIGAATPRKKQPIMISVGGRDIPATYYPPWRFVEYFSGLFRVSRIVGLPTIVPPAYLSNYYVQLGRTKNLIEKAEEKLSGRFPLNRLGDQTLFVFQKR